MTLKNRVVKLETAQGIGARLKYMCVITPAWAKSWDSPEEKAKGYKIQPYMKAAGGTGGDEFYISTWEEVQAFATRPDVDLFILNLVYETSNNPGASA